LFWYVYLVALRRYYMFNSDHAVQIIMARYFTWESADFYYWGQNRIGSLVPLVLMIPIRVFHLPALASAVGCAVGFYGIVLGLMFACARGVIEKSATLLAFFLIPVGCYLYLLYGAHPYTPVMMLTVTAFVCLFRSPPSNTVAFVVGLLLSASLWVSEATFAAIVPMLLLLFERRRTLRMTPFRWLMLGLGLCVFVPFIFYWRSRIGFEGPLADYTKLAKPEMLLLGVQKFWPQFSTMVNGQLPVKSWWCDIVAVLLILVNPLVLALRKGVVGEAADAPRMPLMTLLAAHNCVYFLIVLASRHSYFGQGEVSRFWVPVVFFSVYLSLQLAARAVGMVRQRPITFMLVLSGAVCVVGLAMMAPQGWPGPAAFATIEQHRANLRTVRARGATLVTSDYWQSLTLTVLSNFEVLAVPRDFMRTTKFAPEFSPEARQRRPQDFYDF